MLSKRKLIVIKNKQLKISIILWILLTSIQILTAAEKADIIVDKQGKGDYITITDAINALPMYPYQRTIIFIKNGVYEEKLRIEQNYVTLRGENRDSTFIRFAQLREDWVKNMDYSGPAVVNIFADDIVLDNLTIENTQPEVGPHAFAIYSNGTRMIISNCNVISKGADTVSLWNYKEGMYYHTNCYFEGAVDFVCPRGWCFIRDCKFFEIKPTAAIWHAGHFDRQQKLVIRNSTFDGVPGFKLGRHHYEAQFYLLDCLFSSTMADQPIYRVTYNDSSRNNSYYWGDRKYYFNCRKEGAAYEWYKNNLAEAPGNLASIDFTPAWTFEGQWNPEATSPVEIEDFSTDGKYLFITFTEIITVRGKPVLKNNKGKLFKIVMYRFTDIKVLQFVCEMPIKPDDLAGDIFLSDGEIVASVASVVERRVAAVFQLRR